MAVALAAGAALAAIATFDSGDARLTTAVARASAAARPAVGIAPSTVAGRTTGLAAVETAAADATGAAPAGTAGTSAAPAYAAATRKLHIKATPTGAALTGTVTVSQAAVAEVTRIVTVGNVGNRLDSKYFTLYTPTQSVAFWFDVNDDGTPIPAGAAAADRAVEIATILSNENAYEVATKVAAAIDADADFSASAALDVVTVTNAAAGAATNATANTPGFAMGVFVDGRAAVSTDIHLSDTQPATGWEVEVLDDPNSTTDSTVQLVAPWTSGTYQFMRWAYESGALISNVADEASLNITADLTIVVRYGGVIYVDVNAPPGGDGSSWANAFTDLQAAMDAEWEAQADDEVWVAAGLYNPSKMNDADYVCFKLHRGLRLYGGFVGGETSRGARATTSVVVGPNIRRRLVNETVLEGYLLDVEDDFPGPYVLDVYGNPVSVPNCVHIVVGSDDAVMDGMVIQHGPGIGDVFPYGRGGGMANFVASPIVRNCVFRWNGAGKYGGNMYNFIASTTIENCLFYEGSAGEWGGAMYNEQNASPKMVDCDFLRNVCGIGGGVFSFRSSPQFNRCYFNENYAYLGGAIYNYLPDTYNNNTPHFTDCVFDNNYVETWVDIKIRDFPFPLTFPIDFRPLAYRPLPPSVVVKILDIYYGNGGAMFNQTASPTLVNCTFRNHRTSSWGAVVHSIEDSKPVFIDCAFADNTAKIRGAVFSNDDSQTQIKNCVFTNNRAPYGPAIYDDSSQTLVLDSTFGDDSDDALRNVAEENEILDYNIEKYAYFWPFDDMLMDYYYWNNGGVFNLAAPNKPDHFLPPRPQWAYEDHPEWGYSKARVSSLPNLTSVFGGKGGCTYADDSSPHFSNCAFLKNEAKFSGGAGCSGRLDVSFDPVPAEDLRDAVDMKPTYYDCRFSFNRAVELGGVSYNNPRTFATFNNCAFEDNHAGPTAAEALARPVSDFWLFSAKGGTFLQRKDLPYRGGLIDARLVYYKGGVFLLGGTYYDRDTDSLIPSKAVWRFEPKDNVWQPVADMSKERNIVPVTVCTVPVARAPDADHPDPWTEYQERLYVLDETIEYYFEAEGVLPGAGTWTVVTTTEGRGGHTDGTVQGGWIFLLGNKALDIFNPRYPADGTLDRWANQTTTPLPGGYNWNSLRTGIPDGLRYAHTIGDTLWAINGTQPLVFGEKSGYWSTVTPGTPSTPNNPGTSQTAPPLLHARTDVFAVGISSNIIAVFAGGGSSKRDVETLNKGVPNGEDDGSVWIERGPYPGRGWRRLFAGGQLTGADDATPCWVGGGLGDDKEGKGGAMYNDGATVVISNSSFLRNYARPELGEREAAGGAIFSTGGSTVTVSASIFRKNWSAPPNVTLARGGAISQEGGDTTTVSDCEFTENHVMNDNWIVDDQGNLILGPARGGAIYQNGTLAVANSDFYRNIADGIDSGLGGGIYNAGTLTVSRGYFEANQALGGDPGAGGGIAGGGTVAESKFVNNLASGAIGEGGGMDGGDVDDSTFIDNVAVGIIGLGGGINGGDLMRCYFEGNIATGVVGFGGGAEASTAIQSVFIENYAKECGGGMDFSNQDQCRFEHNSAGYGGGGTSYQMAYTKRTIYIRNSAPKGGGVIDAWADANGDGYVQREEDPWYQNCVFWENQAGVGGGFYTDGGCWLVHCTMSRNYSGTSGGGVFENLGATWIENCVLWGNYAEWGDGQLDSLNEYNTDNSVTTFSYSCIKGGREGEGNIGQDVFDDPLFIDPQLGNLRLGTSSRSINRASPDLSAAEDIDGNPRDAQPDMGAYESIGAVAKMVVEGNYRVIEDGDDTPEEQDFTDFQFVDPGLGTAGKVVSCPANNQLTLAATASSADGAYTGMSIVIKSGAITQTRIVTAYVGISRVVTVDANWTLPNPNTTFTYDIRPFADRTYLVRNYGVVDLELTGTPRVEILGVDAAQFSVIEPPVSPIVSGDTKQFTVRFRPLPGNVDEREATIKIVNNDATVAPYNFSILGHAGVAMPKMTVFGLRNLLIVTGSITPDPQNGTDFGYVDTTTGATVSTTFAIKNLGSADLTLDALPSVAITGLNAADFTVSAQPVALVAPYATTSFAVTFRPLGAGVRTATVTIANNDPTRNPYKFTIQGFGNGPVLVVSGNGQVIFNDYPAPYSAPQVENNTDFGAVSAAHPTVVHLFTAQNAGWVNLLLTGDPLVNIVEVPNDSTSHAEDFTVTLRPADTLPPGWRTNLEITFSPVRPVAPGATSEVRSALVQIANTDTPYEFVIQGTVIPNIPPVAIATPDKGTPSTISVTLSGSESYDPDGGPLPLTYAWTQDAGNPAPVSLSSTTAVNPTFALPAASGAYRFTLTVSDGDATDSDGASIYVGDIVVLEILAASVKEDSTGVTGRVKLPPTSTVALPLTVNLTSNDTGEATVPATVQITERDTWVTFNVTPVTDGLVDGPQTVTITASAAGCLSDTAGIVVEDVDGPLINVLGNGVTIPDGQTVPTILNQTDFGPVTETSGAVSRTFAILNEGTAASNLVLILNPAAVNIEGPNAIDFTVTNQASTPVVGQNRTTFSIRFAPRGSSWGKRQATVKIYNSDLRFGDGDTVNDPGERPYTFAIAGTRASEPVMEVEGNNETIANGDMTPSTADWTDFGNWPVGEYFDRVFTVHNNGNGRLGLNGNPRVILSGSHAADFEVANLPDAVVGGNSATNFTIRFTPQQEGFRYATVSIPNTDTDETPYTFAIRGGNGPAVFGAPTIRAKAGNAKITISWGPVAGAETYNLYWALAAGVTLASNKDTDVRSQFVDSPLINGTTYFYRATAVTADGTESDLSNEVSATPSAAAGGGGGDDGTGGGGGCALAADGAASLWLPLLLALFAMLGCGGVLRRGRRPAA